jgi:hypothetical protein
MRKDFPASTSGNSMEILPKHRYLSSGIFSIDSELIALQATH